jgi:outer membrane lipopolysaccharide assembly protein LptE/RlpB
MTVGLVGGRREGFVNRGASGGRPQGCRPLSGSMMLRMGPLFLLVVALIGCGYQLRGHAGTIPANLRRISVPIFTNATPVSGLEDVVTTAVRTQFQRDGRVHIGTDADATAQLRGAVQRYLLTVIATDSSGFVEEYRIETAVHVVLEDLQEHRTLLDRSIIVRTTYLVSQQQLVPTAIARERAVLAAAHDVGDQVVSLVLDWF